MGFALCMSFKKKYMRIYINNKLYLFTIFDFYYISFNTFPSFFQMEYNRDYLRARYNLRRLFKLNRRKSRCKSLKCTNVKASKNIKAPKTISINLLTTMYKLMMDGIFDLVSLSRVIHYFGLHN